MKFELALVESFNKDYWIVKGITTSLIEGLLETQDRVRISYLTYLEIENALKDNKNVYINKNFTTPEVMPSDLLIRDSEENITELKEFILNKLENIIYPAQAKSLSFDILNFTLKNNILCSKGYFITDDNREEKYIEILESGDKDLFKDLESYLESFDNLKNALYFENKIKQYKSDIENCLTKDEVFQKEQEFLESLNKD